MLSQKRFFSTYEERKAWAADYALKKMTEHNLIADGWTFHSASFYEEEQRQRYFGRDGDLDGDLGSCHDAQKLIVLYPFAFRFNKNEIKHTILHEIAHALSPNDNIHGEEFLEQCDRVMPRSMAFREYLIQRSKTNAS